MKYFAYCRKSTEGDDRQALSIPAQIDEIKRTFAEMPETDIIEWLEEKKSAKAPGRPIYSEMIKRIERGEADGIVAWHPDRLARNSVDGGWIIHLLDQNVIKDLKFVSYTFEKSPQGMFMLQIMFGQSKYYVDALSVNVKRGLRKRFEMGWHLNLAPLGYRNDRETNTIVPDAARFPLMRRMWEMLLSEGYSVSQINEIANEQWGFRTPVRKKSGGKRLSLSATYRIFTNPFYAGVLVWNGDVRSGKHKPMVSIEEFERGRRVLIKQDTPRAAAHEFAYTGLIKCSCGLSVTAEEKVKPSGRQYTYYHCTRRAQPRCCEPAVPLSVLEQQISFFLARITISDSKADQLSKAAQEAKKGWDRAFQERQASIQRSLTQSREQLRNLTDLRVRNLVDDCEFVERKKVLKTSLLALEQALGSRADDKQLIWLELADAAITFRKYAAVWFENGTVDDKRRILETLSSNSVLSGKILNIQARVPFELDADPAYFPSLWGGVEDVGTLPPKSIISHVAALRTVADARESGRRVQQLSLSLPMSRTAPRGRASWRAPRAPHPALNQLQTLDDKAA